MGHDSGGGEHDAGMPPVPDAARMRFQEMFEFAPDCQLITDARGLILEVNQAAAVLFRWPKSFLVGKPLGLLVGDSHWGRFYERLSRLGLTRGSDEFEAQIGRRGEFRDVVMRVVVTECGPAPPVAFRWLIQDITERRRAESVRADLLRRLVTAQEDERRRVARELHDSVGQLLAALTLSVHAARDAGPASPAMLARLDDVQRVADELARTTHDLAVRLRPTALDDFGLLVALQHYLREWSALSGVEVHFQASGLEAARFRPEIETALYRIAQESLTNVLRHARARLASVVIDRREGYALMVVEDDGAGFDPDSTAASGRLGLLGMSERITLVGGALQIESCPGAGTTVRAYIPLEPAPGGPKLGRIAHPPGR